MTTNAIASSLNDVQSQPAPVPSRYAQLVVRLSISVSVLVVLVITTELISGALLSIPQAKESGGIHHSYYKDKPWAAQYWREFQLSKRQQYKPYVVWRRAPFKGKYINVDENGLRRTVNPDCSLGARQIWTLGASTLWGMGAPDDQTIPSILSREYARAVGPVCVTNFAESAWVSSQNVIELEIALKHAARPPDLVIFYDGLADVLPVYQSGSPDVHFGFEKVRSLVEAGQAKRSSFAYVKETGTWRLITSIMTEVASTKNTHAPTRRQSPNVDNLAKKTVENYRANMKVVAALSAEYGFPYISFWEPMALSGNKPLTPAERDLLASIERETPGLPELTRRTYDLMFSANDLHITDISDTFDHSNSDIYMEVGHITPEGNRQVALRILDFLRKSDKAPVSKH